MKLKDKLNKLTNMQVCFLESSIKTMEEDLEIICAIVDKLTTPKERWAMSRAIGILIEVCLEEKKELKELYELRGTPGDE